MRYNLFVIVCGAPPGNHILIQDQISIPYLRIQLRTSCFEKELSVEKQNFLPKPRAFWFTPGRKV
jgi:hypothetical protein